MRAASDACHAAPHRATPHLAYGEAWLALDEPARAEPAFATALRIDPGLTEAWVSYGLCRHRQGAHDEAIAAMRQALARTPFHAVATANLGAFLRLAGQVEAAERLLRQAIDYDPGNAGARLNLSGAFLRAGRPADALAVLDAATMLPTEPAALQLWGLQECAALVQLGRLDEARPLLAVVVADLGPIPMDSPYAAVLKPLSFAASALGT